MHSDVLGGERGVKTLSMHMNTNKKITGIL